MRADNSHHLIAAARRRSQSTRRRALATLRRMDNAGLPVTAEALARNAGVSRSWLYSQPDLRAEIEQLRERTSPAARHTVPDRQRGSVASLLRRLELSAQRIHELEADNKRLRHALAEALAPPTQRPTVLSSLGAPAPHRGNGAARRARRHAPGGNRRPGRRVAKEAGVPQEEPRAVT